MIGDDGRVRIALCVLTLIVAAVAALGWATHIELAKAVLPGLTTMKADTAVALAICAVGLLYVSRPIVAIAAGSLVAALGVATLAEYVFGIRLGLDQALVADPRTTSMPFPGRMSPETALALVATGCGIPLLAGAGGHSRARLTVAHAIAIVPGAIGYLSLVGYIYGVERLYNLGPYVSVALNTAVCLCLLSAAMLLTRRSEGWTFGYRHRPIASKVLVRLVTIGLVLPFATGLLTEAGVALGLYQPLFGPALFAMLASLSLIWLALRAARSVRMAEDEMIVARREARDKGRALDASNARYRYVVENLSQLIWTARTDGEVVFSNARWLAYTGQTLEETTGLGWAEAVHPDDRERVLAHWHGAVEGLHAYDLEYRLRRHDGAYRWFKVVGMPMIDGEGLWIGSNTDIQEIVDAREVLASSREDLERRVAERTAALMAVEEQLRQSQKMEAVGQLTGGIAHDFNNLLAGITGSLDLLQSRIGKGRYDDVPRFIAAAQGAAKRAASLTHRLLAFSRRQTLVPKPTDINRLVAGLEDLVRRTVGPAIDVEIVAAGGLWNTLIDAGQLENALLNLCINARDAMPEGGKLTVETANRWFDGRSGKERDIAAGQYVSLCVSDNGTGMPPDVVERAFDPFFTTKPIGAGTGLGLSMIFGFVQQSGGQARIYSEVGQGTTVCLYLPRDHGDAEPIENAVQPRALARAGHGECVLVVDDEPTVRMLVTEILDELGYQSLEASDGAAGLRILQSDTTIDLLITDVGLPGGMNGRQMADAARIARPDLKVLFITGYAENAVLSHGHLEPGMHVITKPFAMDVIASRIKTLLVERTPA